MVRDQKGSRSGGQRPLRVGEELRHALAELLARGDVRDPDLRDVPVTVSEVRVSPDLRQATAYVLPLGGQNADQVLAALDRCAPYLRGRLARMVRLKFSPGLQFRLDNSFEHASHIEALLRRSDVAADRPQDDEDDGGRTADDEDGGHGPG